MTIRYVQRNAGGTIIASFAAPQPGLAEEAIDSSLIPAPPAPYVPPTPLDWFMRLSSTTQAALDTAARTDTAVSLALRYASGVTYVDVTDPRTKQNVDLLLSKGLITQAEHDTLLTP